MKKSFSLLLLFIAASAFPQQFRGVAVYEFRTDRGIVLNDGKESPENKKMMEYLKKMDEKTFTLKFDKSASLYEEPERFVTMEDFTGQIKQVRVGGDELLYKSLKEKISLRESEILDTDFLITDSLIDFKWKLLGETKKIGNYTCYKAESEYDPSEKNEKEDKAINILETKKVKKVITAWYTTDVPVSHGPDKYWGLPGLILEVNDGKTVVLCSKLTLNPTEKFEIKALKKGKKITSKELNAMLSEKMSNGGLRISRPPKE